MTPPNTLFTRAARRLAWLWPLVACLLGYAAIHKDLNRLIHFDAQYVYLPAARAFLEQGWSYLLTSDSYRVVPLAYLWPALWGADPEWIRIANAGLWTGIVYFMWQTSCAMGGTRAGIAAMLLLVLHPDFVSYFSTELTEPIFLFGLFGLLHQLSRAFIEQKLQPTTVWLGAGMLTITLLSRPVLQLLAPVLFLACLLGSTLQFNNPSWTAQKPLLRQLTWMLGLGLVVPAMMIIKNGLCFGLWGLGTGSGAGLYLGTHPLSQGTEPPFLGLVYDVNDLSTLVTAHGDHLGLAADRAARAAAILQMKSMPLGEGLAFYVRKLWWWIMHHPAQMNTLNGSLRKYRLIELVSILAAFGLLAWKIRKFERPSGHRWQSRPILFAALLSVLFLAMLVQLIPILYNARYSTALLDPWLMLLAAFSIGMVTQGLTFKVFRDPRTWSFSIHSTHSVGATLACFAALLISIPLIYNLAKRFEYPVAIDPSHIGETRVVLEMQSADDVRTSGMEYIGDHKWVVNTYPGALQVEVPALAVSTVEKAAPNNAMWLSQVAIRPPRGNCGKTEVSYQTESGAILQPAYKLPLLLKLQSNGALQAFATHANGELRPKTAGSYRMVLHCPAGTLIEWRGTQLLASEHTSAMATRLLPAEISAP